MNDGTVTAHRCPFSSVADMLCLWNFGKTVARVTSRNHCGVNDKKQTTDEQHANSMAMGNEGNANWMKGGVRLLRLGGM